MAEAVIVAATRSPIGRARKGSLVSVRPDDLASQIVSAALAQVPALEVGEIDDLIMGCAEPHFEQGGNIARRVAVDIGTDGLPGTTVNRFCSSSLQATRMAFHAIRAGEGNAFVAAGVEMVSWYRNGADTDTRDARNPRYGDAAERTAERSATAAEWIDPRGSGMLPDIYISMGETAENVAALCAVDRQEQDAWALRSHQRAVMAEESGFFGREITPVTLRDGTIVQRDDGPRPDTSLETLRGLKTVFREAGTVTAGNCCPLNDGAAAVVVMSEQRASELGITPMARIVSTGVSALSPEIMGLGPVEASRQALARAGMSMSDIDLFEINEAFAAQVIASARALEMDMDRLNVHGGAIALGHPFGMTGTRILTTLINGLVTTDRTFGLETMCVGGGQGMAMVIERLG